MPSVRKAEDGSEAEMKLKEVKASKPKRHRQKKPLAEILTYMLPVTLWMWVLGAFACVGSDGPMSPQKPMQECFWGVLQSPNTFTIFVAGTFFFTFVMDNLFQAVYPFICRGGGEKEGPLPSTRWFFVHSLVNMALAWYAYDDLVACARDIGTCATQKWSFGDEVMGIAVSVHFYHIVFYHLQAADWLHHGMTAVLTTPPILLCQQTRFISFSLFFMTGLPGGIDYLLLTLVKLGWLEGIVEKKLYVVITVWLRGPGVLAGATMNFVPLFDPNTKALLSWPIWAGILWNSVICYWNGMYFMHCTLSDYYRPGRARVAS